MMKKWFRKWTAIALTGVIAVGLAGCRNVSLDEGDNQEADSSFYTYVPESWKWKDDSDIYMKNLQAEGNRLYFSDSGDCYKYLDLDNPDAEPTVIYDGSSRDVAEEGCEICVEKIFPDGEGEIVVITRQMPSVDEETATEEDWIRQQQESIYRMKKVEEDGAVVFENDITEYVFMDREYAYLVFALGDGEGNICLSNGNSYVWIFDKEGKHLNDVRLKNNARINDYIWLGVLGDGRIAVATDTNEGRDMSLIAYDVKEKDFSDVYGNLPSDCWGTSIMPGPNGGILLNGSSALYEYDLESRIYTEIMKWKDYDIEGEYIRFTSALESGDIVAYYDDRNGKAELILLKRTESAGDGATEETTSVLTLGYKEEKYKGLSQTLELAITNFNKNSDKYKIEAKGYDDSVNFNNDIVAGNGPDMFVAEDVNMELFAVKGIIEDLTPYLENSQVINRSELFESVLDAYTIDGVLCTIPVAVYFTTLVGRASEVGEEAGWTLDEMLAYVAQYPDSNVFPYDDRETILYYLVRNNLDSYVNWEAGECYFDSGEFKKILELASQYGEEFDDSMSEPYKLANHKALLCRELIASPTDWQKLEKAFGEPVNAVGFPTVKSTGTIVGGVDGICISADSPNKEVAWSFMESLLSQTATEDMGGMPVNKTAYSDMMEKLMEPLYQYDEEGNMVLDENGEPVEIPYTEGYWFDFSYDMYAVTQEQADRTLALINRGGRAMSYGEELWPIIMEEAAPYFEGDKTVDEVAEIIQNRARIYVLERR